MSDEELNKMNERTAKEEGPLSVDTGLITQAPLTKAVTTWANYLGIACNIKVVEKPGQGFTFEVQQDENGKADLDLTQMGTGVSQVLPILVMGLLAEPGSILIFEQPELHLHPKVQARLADFFFMLTLMGKQCIVETHSEYLIDRLRYRTVSDPTGKGRENGKGIFQQNTAIYFAEKNEEGSTEFRRININQYGALSEWPDGFFDESQKISDLILYESIKRQNEEEGEDND